MRKIWKNVKNLEYFKVMFFSIYLLRDTTLGMNEEEKKYLGKNKLIVVLRNGLHQISAIWSLS